MDKQLAVQEGADALVANALSYEHPEVVDRLERVLGMTNTEAEVLFADVKKYLCLVVASGERLTPPHAIDLGWHEFILYTRDYAAFCNRMFGKFVHHTPNPALTPHLVETAERAIVLARGLFGDLSHNWTRASGDCSPDSDCHGDDSCGGDV
jgi:hypothetical protein